MVWGLGCRVQGLGSDGGIYWVDRGYIYVWDVSG